MNRENKIYLTLGLVLIEVIIVIAIIFMIDHTIGLISSIVGILSILFIMDCIFEDGIESEGESQQ